MRGDGRVQGRAARPLDLAETIDRQVTDGNELGSQALIQAWTPIRSWSDDRHPVRELGGRHASRCLAMMSLMISLVPPPMVMSRTSRAKRSTGYSRM